MCDAYDQAMNKPICLPELYKIAHGALPLLSIALIKVWKITLKNLEKSMQGTLILNNTGTGQKWVCLIWELTVVGHNITFLTGDHMHHT